MFANASYFAFTATPKNKTLELFGEKTLVGDKVQFRSPEELTYTTKQAIQEKFILDVVENYTTYDSFYQVAKTVADDPEFDKVKALKKIRHYVESHDKAIRRKAEIMVDHFIAQVAGKQKIGGKARAMIVCNGIARAIDYWREVSDYLTQIKSPYKAIVAYSGDFEIGGQKKTEADLNGLQIPDGSGGWMTTNPNDFNATLEARNKEHKSLIKPSIRLFKYWNAAAGFPFRSSFEMEKWVCGLSFWFPVNQKDYFFAVIDNLNTSSSYTQWVNDEITRAKTIVANVRQYEKDEMPVTAENEIKKLFRL